jgi:hypothetical protein
MSGAGAESTSFVQGMCTASHPFEMSVHNKLSPMQCKIPPCLFHQRSQPNRIRSLNFEKKYFTGNWIIYLIIMVVPFHLSISSPFLCYTRLSFSEFTRDLPWHPWISTIHLDKSAHFITPISDVTISICLGVIGCYLSKLMITSNESCSIQRIHCIQNNDKFVPFTYFIFSFAITRNIYQRVIFICSKIRLCKNRLKLVQKPSFRFLTYKPSEIKIDISNLSDEKQHIIECSIFSFTSLIHHRPRPVTHNTAFLPTPYSLDPDSIRTLLSRRFSLSSTSTSFWDSLAARRCWSQAKLHLLSCFHIAHRSRLASASAHE